MSNGKVLHYSLSVSVIKIGKINALFFKKNIRHYNSVIYSVRQFMICLYIMKFLSISLKLNVE